jgi:hypothetical protein
MTVNRSGPPAPAPGPQDAGPGHSDIFDRLGANAAQTDLVALVAYSLYQQRKRDWQEAFHTKHGRYPNQTERDGHALTYGSAAIADLRTQAEGAMFVFAENIVIQRMSELRIDALSAETRSLLSGIDTKLGHLGGYWHHIVGHIVGFVVLLGIGAIVLALIRFGEPSVGEGLHWFDRKFSAPHGGSEPGAIKPESGAIK